MSGDSEGGKEGGTNRYAYVKTAKDFMQDGALKEAFAARGRHKKSPILAR